MRKFLNGDTRLVVAYWVYGLLLPSVVGGAIGLSGVNLEPGTAFAILFGLLLLSYWIVWSVGTWRSASKYTGLKFWAWFTKFHIALPPVLLALAFVLPAFKDSKVENSQVPLPANTATPSVPDAPVIAEKPLAIPAPSKVEPTPATPPATPTVDLQKRAENNSQPVTKKPYLVQANDTIDLNAFYARMDELAASQPEPVKEPTLGWLDTMRYESCQQDAAKAPTPEGVQVGLRVCREKFKQ